MGYPLETTQFSTQHTLIYFPCKWYIVTTPFHFAIYIHTHTHTCNIPLSHIILVIAHSLPWLDETSGLCCYTTVSPVNCFTLYFPVLRLCYISRVFSFLNLCYPNNNSYHIHTHHHKTLHSNHNRKTQFLLRKPFTVFCKSSTNSDTDDFA